MFSLQLLNLLRILCFHTFQSNFELRLRLFIQYANVDQLFLCNTQFLLQFGHQGLCLLARIIRILQFMLQVFQLLDSLRNVQ